MRADSQWQNTAVIKCNHKKYQVKNLLIHICWKDVFNITGLKKERVMYRKVWLYIYQAAR